MQAAPSHINTVLVPTPEEVEAQIQVRHTPPFLSPSSSPSLPLLPPPHSPSLLLPPFYHRSRPLPCPPVPPRPVCCSPSTCPTTTPCRLPRGPPPRPPPPMTQGASGVRSGRKRCCPNACLPPPTAPATAWRSASARWCWRWMRTRRLRTRRPRSCQTRLSSHHLPHPSHRGRRMG